MATGTAWGTRWSAEETAGGATRNLKPAGPVVALTDKRRNKGMSDTIRPHHRRHALQAVAPLFVDLFERYMPDSFVPAIGLTAVTAILALLIAFKGSPEMIVSFVTFGLQRQIRIPRSP